MPTCGRMHLPCVRSELISREDGGLTRVQDIDLLDGAVEVKDATFVHIHVAARQDRLEFEIALEIRTADRRDRQIDLAGIELGEQIRQVAIGLLDHDVALPKLEARDHLRDHRIHEERNTADLDATGCSRLETADNLNRLA